MSLALKSITVSVNDTPTDLHVESRETLLEALRDRLRLTGTKSVCTQGNCGACTVHLDGRAVYACLVLAAECDARTVRTIEGIADGETLHPVQQAFLDRDAFQCGYCTPGQIMSLTALLDAAGDTPVDDVAILRATSGNLCRCGAYRHILEAARQAAGLDPATELA